MTLSISLADQRFDRTKSIGILNASIGLCRNLTRQPDLKRITLFTNPTLPPVPPAGAAEVITMACSDTEDGRFWRLWWDQFGVYRAARRAGNDWLLLPKGYAPFLSRCPVKLASYVHDITQEFYRERYPGAFPRFENSYFCAGLRAAITRSRVVLVSTLFAAAEIRKLANRYGVAEPRIEYVGIGFEPPPKREPVPRSRIMALASRWPHKRTDLAVQFLARWQDQRKFDGTVDWVGHLPDGVSLPPLSNWRLHPRLSQPDYDQLLAESRALVYVSEYEGFGMPPVEAVLGGACPVYSDLPPTREVMGGAGCAFDNASYESFASAMDEALRTPEPRLTEWSSGLLARHNWQAIAERTVAALRSA